MVLNISFLIYLNGAHILPAGLAGEMCRSFVLPVEQA
jgi:hypothetical protein